MLHQAHCVYPIELNKYLSLHKKFALIKMPKSKSLEIIFPTIIILLLFGIDFLLPFSDLFHPKKWILLSFFILMAYSSKKISDLSLTSDQTKFFSYYVLSLILRLILTIIFLFVFIYLKIANIPLFVLNYLFFYFFYQIFEIYYLITNLQANSK